MMTKQDETETLTEEEDDEQQQQQIFSLQTTTLPTRRFYLTRRGKILQSTTERYLRDDLGYGTMLIPDNDSKKSSSNNTIAGKIVSLIPYTIEDVSSLVDMLLSTTTTTTSTSFHNKEKKRVIRLAVVDTNVLLHHMDVLEYLRDVDEEEGDDDDDDKHHCAIANAIVIPQTTLEECRHRSLVMYRRATDLVRSSGHDYDNDNSKTAVGGEKKKKKRKKRCVIVFADVHHVDTQLNNKQFQEEEEEEGRMIINDENDARLRNVALFYGHALHDYYTDQKQQQQQNDTNSIVEVVFLSDDVQSRKLAIEEQQRQICGGDSSTGEGLLYYETRSMREHVTLLQEEDPTLNLLDMVAQFNTTTSGSRTDEEDIGAGSSSRRNYYSPHIASSTLSLGLQTNKYYQGIYRSNRDTYDEGYVTIRRGEDRVAIVISGRDDINRAVDGDIVAIELFSIDRWLGDASRTSEGGEVSKKEDADESTSSTNNGAKSQEVVSIAADTAEPSVRDTENIAEEVPVDDEGLTLRRPTGKVVGVIRRNFHKNYCGSICTIDTTPDEKEGGTDDLHPHDAIAAKHEREHPDGITSTVVFFSIDQRVPPILLRTTQRDRLVGMRILVSIDSWPADSEYPLGHYVKTLGVAGTKDTETEVLLQEFRIPCEPFPAKVLACLPPADYKIELEPGRADLRHIPVLSIDPPGCKDIDDALHCTELPNGNWQVGVHIADVTHYVEAGTAIDLEAANRSTSTYLVNKRLDMLPSLLTTDLCSLKGNVDR